MSELPSSYHSQPARPKSILRTSSATKSLRANDSDIEDAHSSGSLDLPLATEHSGRIYETPVDKEVSPSDRPCETGYPSGCRLDEDPGTPTEPNTPRSIHEAKGLDTMGNAENEHKEKNGDMGNNKNKGKNELRRSARIAELRDKRTAEALEEGQNTESMAMLKATKRQRMH